MNGESLYILVYRWKELADASANAVNLSNTTERMRRECLSLKCMSGVKVEHELIIIDHNNYDGLTDVKGENDAQEEP